MFFECVVCVRCVSVILMSVKMNTRSKKTRKHWDFAMILKYVCINCMCVFGRIGGKALSDHEKRWHSVNKLD